MTNPARTYDTGRYKVKVERVPDGYAVYTYDELEYRDWLHLQTVKTSIGAEQVAKHWLRTATTEPIKNNQGTPIK